MGFPKFPPKPPKLSEKLREKNPMKSIGAFIRDGVESIESAVADIESAARDIDRSAPTQPEVKKPVEGAITDEETLRYQIELQIDDLQHLETEHLPNQGRIAGKVCDCIAKAARDLRRHARETIPIAARQGKDTSIYSQTATWAQGIMEMGTAEAVNSGKYDEEYLKQSGAASSLRKAFEALLAEVRPKGFRETCQECGALEDLKQWMERRKAEKR